MAAQESRKPMNIYEIMRSPLFEVARPNAFVRLVLAEAAFYGMPPRVVWRTHPKQPVLQRVQEVEQLAMKQRALIVFQSAPFGHLVGTAEIICATGNLHEDAGMPDPYLQVFHWAAVDVLATLTGKSKETIWNEKGWAVVQDEEVLSSKGRYHPTYQEIATAIRRHIIAHLEQHPDNPREFLAPLAETFVAAHLLFRGAAEAAQMPELGVRPWRWTDRLA